MNSTEMCKVIIRHLESTGEEILEKNYIENGEIKASVFAIVGPNAAEMTAMFREWANKAGFKRTH